MNNEEIMKRYNNIKHIVNVSLKDDTTGRLEGFNNLMSHLEDETEWLTSPASTKYHCSFEGGLLLHSVSVAETILRMKKILAPDITNDSAAIVGLLHDIGKIGQYITKEPTERQKQYGYPGSIVFNSDLLYMEHEARSLFILSKYIDLTEDEWAAIEYHNQPWNGQSSAFRKNRLMTLLQNADYWSALYLEEGN